MRKPRNIEKPPQPAHSPSPAMFVTWEEGDPKGKALAMRTATRAMANVEGTVCRTTGTSIYQNVAPGNVSVREGLDQRDYDWFRPNERLPELDRDIMLASQQAYDRIGIVHHVIDMMGDFACQGIDLVHPRPGIEKWFKQWFKQVKGRERTERILNSLYRTGNVVIKRGTARLDIPLENRMKRGLASQDAPNSPTLGPENVVDDPPKIISRRIPWEYTILNPMTVEVFGGQLAPFFGQKYFQFAVRLPNALEKQLKNPKAEIEKQMMAQVPAYIMSTYAQTGKIVPLPRDKIEVLYYKRDDWQVWARPMLYAIFTDLRVLAKLKLADLTALDGAISHIRLWKLGDLEHRILPTEAAIERLATVLLNNVAGGSMDLIWGPELNLQETSVDIASFLGEAKYIPTLNAIYAGLGIPASLTGIKSGEGFTNNFISLKTLTERLEYGRSIVQTFWEGEIARVQEAMGFTQPAEIVFDATTLNDDATEKRLMIELADRGVISWEALQTHFGFIPNIEQVRMKREKRKRDRGTLPRQKGPYQDHQEALENIFAQTGAYTPSEFGIELEEKQKGQKSPGKHQLDNDKELEAVKPPPAPPGSPSKGRPPGKKDKKKRKKKVVKPRQSVKSSARFAEVLAWANDAQEEVASLVNPIILGSLGKSNMRQLTDDLTEHVERLKLSVLCRLTARQEIDEQGVTAALSLPVEVPPFVDALLRRTTARHVEKEGRLPGLERARKFAAMAVAMWASMSEGEDGVSDPNQEDEDNGED